jgi:hypothetical protein
MAYDWPVRQFNRTHPRLGTLGEFRGVGANDITRLHSGTDIAVFGGNVEVYSPSVGKVRRFGPNSGPIRVGHFGFNHIRTINAQPGNTYNGVTLPQTLPIYVVEAGSPGYAPRAGVATPARDADFNQGTVPANAPAVAWYRIGPDNYEQATLWPRTLPIGTGVGPTDLHCIYYESDDGPFADGAAVANCLEVFRNYVNNKKPVATALKMYTQVNDVLFRDLGAAGQAVHRQVMGGLDFKLWARSPFNAPCGVYQIDYEIFNHLGNTTGRLNAWTFHKLPADAVSFDFVDQNLSSFVGPNNKFTVYILTNAINGTINAASHWEIENAAKWPDGCYAIRVWIKNIKRSPAAAGQPVQTNDVLYGAEWTVRTLPNNRRQVRVVNKFKDRVDPWTPAFADCKEKREPRRRASRASLR